MISFICLLYITASTSVFKTAKAERPQKELILSSIKLSKQISSNMKQLRFISRLKFINRCATIHLIDSKVRAPRSWARITPHIPSQETAAMATTVVTRPPAKVVKKIYLVRSLIWNAPPTFVEKAEMHATRIQGETY